MEYRNIWTTKTPVFQAPQAKTRAKQDALHKQEAIASTRRDRYPFRTQHTDQSPVGARQAVSASPRKLADPQAPTINGSGHSNRHRRQPSTTNSCRAANRLPHWTSLSPMRRETPRRETGRHDKTPEFVPTRSALVVFGLRATHAFSVSLTSHLVGVVHRHSHTSSLEVVDLHRSGKTPPNHRQAHREEPKHKAYAPSIPYPLLPISGGECPKLGQGENPLTPWSTSPHLTFDPRAIKQQLQQTRSISASRSWHPSSSKAAVIRDKTLHNRRLTASPKLSTLTSPES